MPPVCAYRQIKTSKLRDDCDGFHAAMLHILTANNIECYLLTAVAIGGGHCILIFRFDNKWHILDYTRVYDAEEAAIEVINKYNEVYPKLYETKPVFYNGIVQYNYKKGKYVASSVDKLK